jgi:alkylation response protein AidB-like acyl-CoA dehydrogenase/electron transfer flavoprotein alpha subunit
VTDGRKAAIAPAAILAEAEETVGRLDAELLASEALLLRVHARLESGFSSQPELALLRVWLNLASASQDDCEALIQRLLVNLPQDGRPIIHPAAGPRIVSYEDYLEMPAPYDSGDFLVAPINPAQPRMLPELVQVDPTLAERNRQIRDLLSEQFGKPRQMQGPPALAFENYERYIEHQHRPDDADLDFCREHGFFRMTIPQELGGEGGPKIDYYLLTTNAQRLGDVALSLTIQINTSIGTTPVLLARDKDLPKALKDIEGFLGDSTLQRQIQTGLEKLIQQPVLGDISHFTEGFRDLQDLLTKAIFSRTVLYSLFHRFAEEWNQCEKAQRDFNRAALQTHLAALESWIDACRRAEVYRGELRRRSQACDLFLQWVSSGQISAFALTEPSAGSDTARVATRAKLRSVLVEEQADGSFRFIPAGSKQYRILLDAERLEFHDRKPTYRWSAAETAPLRFDEYDYETDHSGRQRYYQANGRKVYFTDIGQLRQRDGRLWYDYWELTGAKMWITNGRMAGIMCLYAKTDEGVTGFIVDRHAEGLIVGKDEAKMGQCGSPTNELALQAVRVPRENVIGLEGRGQVNALEALNVGRAGLAMSAMAPMEGLIAASRDFAQATYGEVPAWVDWRLQRMEESRFTAEALAFEVIGRFEHPDTHSLRMESAIAKTLCGELLHEVIEYAEEIHGLAGQTEYHLVEKRKRDARVLTIYEGTDEIQRFFILKDLAGEVAARWSRSSGSLSPHIGREGFELEALKLQFHQRLDSVLDMFGQELWQSPNLQANCFLLSEAAAWLKGADGTLARLAWLDLGQRMEDFNARSATINSESLELGRRALTRCYSEVQHRLKRFDEELMHLRRGYYAPEIRAASLLLQGSESEATKPDAIPLPQDSLISREGVSKLPNPASLLRTLSILVIVEPTAAGIPHPQVSHGRLLEPFLPLSESSRSALEAALRIRDQREKAVGSVTIQVVAVGARGLASVLREPLSLGVDRVRLILPDSEAVTPASAAAALVAVLGSDDGFDLILGGEEGEDQEEGLLVRLVAQGLNIPWAGSVSQVVVKGGMLSRHHENKANTIETIEGRESMATGDGYVLVTSSTGRDQSALPLAVSVEKDLPLREFTTVGYLAALGKNVELIRWPREVDSQAVELLESLQLATTIALSENSAGSLAPKEAANHLLLELGLGRMSAPPGAFQGSIEDVADPILLGGNRSRVIGIIASDSSGRLQSSATSVLKAVRLLATTTGSEPVTLLMTPLDESLQRQAVAQCLAWGRWDIVLLCSTAAEASPALRGQVLIYCWPDRVASPRAVVGESWTELALAAVSGRQRKTGLPALRIRQLQWDQGRIILMSSRARGKLQTRLTLDPQAGVTPWISLAPEAEIRDGEILPLSTEVHELPVRIQRWVPRLASGSQPSDWQRETGLLLDEVKREIGVARLADADFIVDVGFGVGNRDGFEAVIEPLQQALRNLGVRNLAVGGSRKVTEELHLLPADRQIGQSGVSVNPQILLAIGISGAPQHLNYIGSRATILAFNRDPEAPLMTLNQRQPRPRVFPIVGDIFETVPAFIAALKNEAPSDPSRHVESVRK